MASQRFRITYADPETGEPREHVCAFEDTPGIVTFADGSTTDVGTITARAWAEDLGYTLADKGAYRVEAIR